MKFVTTLNTLFVGVVTASFFQPASTFLSAYLSPPLYSAISLPPFVSCRFRSPSLLSSSFSSLGKDSEEERVSNITNSKNSEEEKNARQWIFQDDECHDLCENWEKEEDNDSGNIIPGRDVPKAIPHYAAMRTKAAPSAVTKETTTTNEENRARQMLNLRWSLTKAIDECDVTNLMTCGEQCRTCEGEGRHECQFCGGTTFLTVGNKLFLGGGQKCPVCNDEGEVVCPDCKGSGWVAKWRNEMNSTNLRP
uniref:CR-type domain-containing protein n=1 Tax=Ditylum brightwellii TaxID=49249 RepID=A0A6V2PC23_9STRA|mmetsp:Transcript_25217/g.33473  ORF Transcript_25217/g.33473 Transcript_25217/m.33473 type:complete len:250 (-) Transcript_25217:32-781(-)